MKRLLYKHSLLNVLYPFRINTSENCQKVTLSVSDVSWFMPILGLLNSQLSHCTKQSSKNWMWISESAMRVDESAMYEQCGPYEPVGEPCEPEIPNPNIKANCDNVSIQRDWNTRKCIAETSFTSAWLKGGLIERRGLLYLVINLG